MTAGAVSPDRRVDVTPGPRHVLIFGELGSGNLGNDASLRAVVDGIRQRAPETTIGVIGFDPEGLASDFAVEAAHISGPADGFPGHRLPRPLRRQARRWTHLRQLAGMVREADLLLVAGAGVIEGELGVRWNSLPRTLLRFALIARLTGTPVAFVAVGASPVAERLSRAMMVRALGLATYRSFRDEFSKRAAADLGVDVASDPVLVDLVFSLPAPSAKQPSLDPGARVAIGLMDYSGRSMRPDDRAATRSLYLQRMVAFSDRLAQRGYEIVLVGGDQLDTGPIAEVAAELHARGHRPVVPPMPQSLDELMAILRDVDIVVGTRYHNLVAALMLNRPTLSVSYAPKNTELLASFGLDDYAQSIDNLDVDKLEQQFDRMTHEAPGLLPRMQLALQQAQRTADVQLDDVLTLMTVDRSART